MNDVQNSVRRQVMIQAHIIEVSLKDNYSLGLDWETVLRFRSEER